MLRPRPAENAALTCSSKRGQRIHPYVRSANHTRSFDKRTPVRRPSPEQSARTCPRVSRTAAGFGADSACLSAAAVSAVYDSDSAATVLAAALSLVSASPRLGRLIADDRGDHSRPDRRAAMLCLSRRRYAVLHLPLQRRAGQAPVRAADTVEHCRWQAGVCRPRLRPPVCILLTGRGELNPLPSAVLGDGGVGKTAAGVDFDEVPGDRGAVSPLFAVVRFVLAEGGA